MAIMYISDLHFDHANIIKTDKRPFADVEEMNHKLIENWNSKVKSDDWVYILGDFCWGKENEWVEYLKQLNGVKTLIKGNHDLKQYGSNLKRYFQDIKDYKEIRDEGRGVILCHYPIPFHKLAYNPDVYMLYGHVHKTREYDAMRMIRKWAQVSCEHKGDCRGNFFNVGCMMPWMNYTPRTLDEIILRDPDKPEEVQKMKSFFDAFEGENK